MPWYITRVELHYANADDYEALHVQMEREGFSRTVRTTDGRRFHLPPAEYFRDTDLDINQVRDSAQRAASRVKQLFAVFVARTDQWAATGLKQAQYAT
jgi:hypothetical protein